MCNCHDTCRVNNLSDCVGIRGAYLAAGIFPDHTQYSHGRVTHNSGHRQPGPVRAFFRKMRTDTSFDDLKIFLFVVLNILNKL
jgi:hypothetical protein